MKRKAIIVLLIFSLISCISPSAWAVTNNQSYTEISTEDAIHISTNGNYIYFTIDRDKLPESMRGFTKLSASQYFTSDITKEQIQSDISDSEITGRGIIENFESCGFAYAKTYLVQLYDSSNHCLGYKVMHYDGEPPKDTTTVPTQTNTGNKDEEPASEPVLDSSLLPPQIPASAITPAIYNYGGVITVDRTKLPKGMRDYKQYAAIKIGSNLIDTKTILFWCDTAKHNPDYRIYSIYVGQCSWDEAIPASPDRTLLLVLDKDTNPLGYAIIAKDSFKKEVWANLSEYLKSTKKDVLPRGNTASNINNAGIAASYEGWIYYSNRSDGGKLYKMKADGTKKTKLNDVCSRDIRIMRNKIFYFQGLTPNNDIGIWSTGRYLHCMNLDGTNDIKVSNDYIHNYDISGDYIYYCAFPKFEKTYKRKLDGSEETLLLDDQTRNIQVSGDWMYYTNSTDIFKIKTDGSKKTLLIKTDQCYSFVQVGDWIYFLKENGIYKIKTDGTKLTKIIDVKTYYFAVQDNWLYYSDLGNGGKLFKIKTDGTGKVKLNNEYSSTINIVGNWIYYDRKPSRTTCELYRIKTDGTGREKVN